MPSLQVSRLSLILLLCLIFDALTPASVLRCDGSGWLDVAPSNHRPVPHSGQCEDPDLPETDFCKTVVTYPIASSLIKASKHILVPKHVDRNNTQLHLLSAKAAAEFDVLMDSHLETVRGRAMIGAHEPDTTRCQQLLQRYVCQIQFPRCFDEGEYAENPVHLHACYSLCHDVRIACGLQHRLKCESHHHQLNPKYRPPTEHELLTDERLRFSDPYAEFHLIDCIDAPPTPWKRVKHYVFYGGPAKYTAVLTAAVTLYAVILTVMGLNKDSTSAATAAAVSIVKRRKERQVKKAEIQVKIRRLQSKYVALDEIRKQLLDDQASETQLLEHYLQSRSLMSPMSASASPSSAAASSSLSPSAASHAPSPFSPQPLQSPRSPVISQAHIAALQQSIAERASKIAEVDALMQPVERELSREMEAEEIIKIEEENERIAVANAAVRLTGSDERNEDAETAALLRQVEMEEEEASRTYSDSDDEDDDVYMAASSYGGISRRRHVEADHEQHHSATDQAYDDGGDDFGHDR